MSFNISMELLVLSFTLALIVTVLHQFFFRKPVKLSEEAEFILEVIKDGHVTSFDRDFTYITHNNVLYKFFVFSGTLEHIQVKGLQCRFNNRVGEIIVDSLREKKRSRLIDALNILRDEGKDK